MAIIDVMNKQIPTACAYTRILKIARTIAGLEGLACSYLLVNSSGLTPDPLGQV
jgi:predicted ATPase with chaperone activity